MRHSIKWTMQRLLMIALTVTLLLGIVATGCGAKQETPAPAGGAAGKIIEWDLASFGMSDKGMLSMALFADTMYKRTGGRFDLKMHWDGALLGEREAASGLKTGLTDIGQIDTTVVEAGFELETLLNLPNLVPASGPASMALEMRDFIEAYRQNPKVQAQNAKWNIVPDLWWTIPMGQVNIAGKKPVKTLADLRGQKVRTPGSAMKGILEKIGAIPVDVEYMEVYSGLQTGIVDFAPDYAYYRDFQKYHEVAKYLTTGFEITQSQSQFWAVNLDSYNALPDDIKKILREEMKRFQLIDQEFAAYEQMLGIEVQKKQFAELNELPAAERQKLVDISKELWQTWAREMDAKGLAGTEMLQFALGLQAEIIKKYGG
ncbi:MAG: TRAP transporter substrate-binding protein DctP [Chloroflexi bacterium]|nr:TRAP transporter substrate-binding protein DctP [Chloroflexota bacterium]